MALCCMSDLIAAVRKSDQKKAVGAFSVGNMEMILGAVQAAEELDTPIILQIAEVRLPHSPLELMGPMMLSAARNAKVDIAVHLDHGLTTATIKSALEMGFTSVMYDGSHLPLEENIKRTKEVAALARTYGAAVEAELGVVGGSEDGSEDRQIVCTDPGDAERFANATKVDALAVAIGNAHGDYRVAPRLQFDVLGQIAGLIETPLVLHGGTGLTAEDFRTCIERGVGKVNIATASFKALMDKVRDYIQSEPSPNYFDMNLAMTAGVYENVRRHIEIFITEREGGY